MACFSVARAVLVRLLFAVHGVVSIWRLATVTDDVRYWYLASVLGLYLFEMSITLGKKRGKEWKWFCPSVFIYLMCVVPAIWFLELYEMDKRIEAFDAMHEYRNVSELAKEWIMEERQENATKEDLHASLGTVLGVNLEIRIPILLTSDEWIRTLEQLLLLLLIIGRWLLPKGKLTHDQLSQLLLVYIGTAADIVEFFDAFKEKEVRYNRILCMAILGIWSFSLIQFSLVLTATRARRDQTGLVTVRKKIKTPEERAVCCSADVYGIIISIMLQDLPFLVLRLLLIFKYKVLSYTNMFFTSKNTIVIILLIYRLIVVQIEKRRQREIENDPLRDHGHRLAESSSLTPSTCSGKSRLIKSGSSYSNGLYPPSRCITPYREHGSCGSLGNIHRIGEVSSGRIVASSDTESLGSISRGGGVGGGMRGNGAATWNRASTLENLNSPV